MALIGTLRNKMGTWVVVFVFVAIACFIIGDLFSNNSFLFNDDEVGEIAGHTVTYEEYQAAIQEREVNYALSMGRQPGEREMTRLRQEAWELLILRHAIQKQYDKVGLAVTADEEEDMIYGKNVDINIKNAFTNPQTGEFDKEGVVNYLRQFAQAPADPQQYQQWLESKTRWELFQRDLIPGRERLKYENLLVKTNYVTKAEAEREYHAQSDVAEIKYLYIPYYTVGDSAAKVSDEDLKAYYNKNIERYKTEETRDLKYVVFPVEPSSVDSAQVKSAIEKVAIDFAQTTNDSSYAASNSEGLEPYGKYNIGSLPPSVQDEELKEGKVIGPFIEGSTYKVIKISKVTTDTVYNARASHILIKWENESDAAKKEAREKAQKIMADLKGGADFAAKAREHSADPGSARSGGDLGWFSSGSMVKPFDDAVFKATKPGLVTNLVETNYGYHIIKVTNTRDNTAYEIATVELPIAASDQTINTAYRDAEAFTADINNEAQFVEKARQQGLPVYEEKELNSQDRVVGSLGEAREVVMWLFREGEEDKVSHVFDLDNRYAIAIMTGLTKEGYKPLAAVEEEILPAVLKEIQGRIIIDKLKGLDGTLEEIATKYGPDANVYTMPDLKMSTSSLMVAGSDPRAVGLAFSLESGERSTPYAGENGVFLIELQNKTIAPDASDYSAQRESLRQAAQGQASFGVAEAIKEAANIEDKRYKFY